MTVNEIRRMIDTRLQTATDQEIADGIALCRDYDRAYSAASTNAYAEEAAARQVNADDLLTLQVEQRRRRDAKQAPHVGDPAR